VFGVQGPPRRNTRLMTGARPTGGLHVGQYFAAFRPFVESEGFRQAGNG